MTHVKVRWTGASALMAMLAACTVQTSSSDGIAVRDSAGVRITTIGTPPHEVEEWAIELPAQLELAGDQPPYFERVTSASWTSGGAIVVLDRQAAALHLFDAAGRFERSLGRRGDGPGEFNNVATVTVAPRDSVYVFERAHRRVSVFHPQTGFARDLAMRGDSAELLPIDVWMVAPDRFALRTERYDLSWVEGYDGRPFVGETEALLSIHDGTGTRIAGPLRFPGGRYAQYSWGSGGLPLSPRPVVAGAPGRIVLGTGERWEITVFDDRLEAIAIIRWPTNEEPITEADRREVRAAVMSSVLGPDFQREILDVVLSERAVAVHRPSYGRVVLGTSGSIWVSRYEPYREQVEWFVLTESGRPIGRLKLPERSRLLAAGDDVIMYVLPDELDVQSVHVARILR